MRIRNRHGLLAFLAVGLALTASPRVLLGQSLGLIVSAGPVLAGRTNLRGATEVAIPLVVADTHGIPLRDLTADQVRIYEDGQAVAVTRLSLDAAMPISICLAIDIGSGPRELDEARAAARELIAVLAPQDHLAVIALGGPVDSSPPIVFDPRYDLGFTPQRDQVAAFLDALEPVAGARPATLLDDGALKAIHITAAATPGARAVVLLAHTRTAPSRVETAPALDLAARPVGLALAAHVPVFTVGIGEPADRNYIERLAAETGAQSVAGAAAGNLRPFFESMAARLRIRYTVQYDSRLPSDGKAHTIDITVRTSQTGAVLRTYFTPVTPALPTALFVTIALVATGLATFAVRRRRAGVAKGATGVDDDQPPDSGEHPSAVSTETALDMAEQPEQ